MHSLKKKTLWVLSCKVNPLRCQTSPACAIPCISSLCSLMLLSLVRAAFYIIHLHIVRLDWASSTTITFVFAMSILRTIWYSHQIVYAPSVAIHVTFLCICMASAKRRWLWNCPSILGSLFCQFNILHMRYSVAVNSFCEMEPPLSLFSWSWLSTYVCVDCYWAVRKGISLSLRTHVIFSVVAMVLL